MSLSTCTSCPRSKRQSGSNTKNGKPLLCLAALSDVMFLQRPFLCATNTYVAPASSTSIVCRMRHASSLRVDLTCFSGRINSVHSLPLIRFNVTILFDSLSSPFCLQLHG